MSNRFLGYAVLVPIFLGGIALFTIDISYEYLKFIDAEVFMAIYGLVTICFLVGLVKLWWIPNRDKQWIPIKNKPFIFVSLGLSVLSALTSDLDSGNQLQMLVGLFAFIMFFTVSFRLITAPTLTDGIESRIDYKRELRTFSITILATVAILALLAYSSPSVNEPESSESNTKPTSTLENEAIVTKPFVATNVLDTRTSITCTFPQMLSTYYREGVIEHILPKPETNPMIFTFSDFSQGERSLATLSYIDASQTISNVTLAVLHEDADKVVLVENGGESYLTSYTIFKKQGVAIFSKQILFPFLDVPSGTMSMGTCQ